MRLGRTDLRQRINSELSIRSSYENMTSFVGLEAFRELLNTIGFSEKAKNIVGRWLPASDFGQVRMILVLLALLISGGRRPGHLDYCRDDVLFGRFGR